MIFGGKSLYLSEDAPAKYNLTWLNSGLEKAEIASSVFFIAALEQEIKQLGSSDKARLIEKKIGSTAYSHMDILALGAISRTRSRAQRDSVEI